MLSDHPFLQREDCSNLLSPYARDTVSVRKHIRPTLFSRGFSQLPTPEIRDNTFLVSDIFAPFLKRQNNLRRVVVVVKKTIVGSLTLMH